jgi:hypothetical protein
MKMIMYFRRNSPTRLPVVGPPEVEALAVIA